MKDRVPGAPGQYKAVISEAELQKMQAGEQFVITMTRDDQPIVEGTPYSKAAVLPDDVAKLICPDIEDPAPADALLALQQGKALAGYGYGETLFSVSGSTETELETNLTSILKEMPNYTTKQLRCQLSFLGGSSYSLTTIFKHTTAYAVVVFERIDGCRLKKVYSSGWQPIEWENPPMTFGEEYRTTERHNGKAEYVCSVDLGTLPDNSTGNVTLPSTPTKIVSLEGSFTDGTITQKFPSVNYADGRVTAVLQIRAEKTVGVKTFENMSAYTGHAIVKYTKD